MKLKYYLRGLGIGIIAATLVMASAGNMKKTVMSDDEVKERASELGMVDQDDVLLSEAKRLAQGSESDDRASDGKQTVSAAGAVSTDAAVSSNQSVSDGKTASAASAAGEGKVSSGSTVKTDHTSSADNIADEGTAVSINDAVSDNKAIPLIITINVSRGDSSTAVARKLLAAGIINDAKQFDSYLCLNGYDRKLVVGDHMIPKDASARDIAELLTSK